MKKTIIALFASPLLAAGVASAAPLVSNQGGDAYSSAYSDAYSSAYADAYADAYSSSSANNNVDASSTNTVNVSAEQGETGETGATGASGATGATGATGSPGATATYNDSSLRDGIASLTAMTNIPGLSNLSTGNTGVGVGVGRYGSSNAFAAGIVHQTGDWNLKASLGRTRHSATAYGVGASYAF